MSRVAAGDLLLLWSSESTVCPFKAPFGIIDVASTAFGLLQPAESLFGSGLPILMFPVVEIPVFVFRFLLIWVVDWVAFILPLIGGGTLCNLGLNCLSRSKYLE